MSYPLLFTITRRLRRLRAVPWASLDVLFPAPYYHSTLASSDMFRARVCTSYPPLLTVARRLRRLRYVHCMGLDVLSSASDCYSTLASSYMYRPREIGRYLLPLNACVVLDMFLARAWTFPAPYYHSTLASSQICLSRDIRRPAFCLLPYSTLASS